MKHILCVYKTSASSEYSVVLTNAERTNYPSSTAAVSHSTNKLLENEYYT